MARVETKRICLWSGPRNISTALMYSFAQRSDTQVFDEPLYSHYLRQTDAKFYHPGAGEIMESMEDDGQKVIQMMMGDHQTPVVFFKNMTHHLLNLDRSFMKETINVILTRDPIDMLPSFGKVIENPSMSDVGYELHVELLEYLQRDGIEPVVLDSKRVLLDPKGVLMRFCELVGIPFENSMLKWSAGARPEDGIWAKYWYNSVHKSTGFAQYHPKAEPFPDQLKHLLHECLPHYEKLMKLAI